MVIASANRLMELRQPCLISSKNAEISVPAWPIPIHQTKFVMANAQATGISMPQMPTPLARRYVIEIMNTTNKNKPNPNVYHQNGGVLRVSTIELICSLTVSKVVPAPTTANGLFGSSGRDVLRCRSSSAIDSGILKLRILIAKLSQIRGPRARVQLRVHGIVQFFGF